MSRWTVSLFLIPTLLIPVALAQTSRSDQKPRSQPAWPCTGNEPSFDPAYAKAAEATGGQLFLLDRSEAGRSAELIIATSRHRETIARVAGKLDGSYRDVRVPVDSSVHSLLVSGTVQCMQTIAIYGPNNIPPEQMGGENHWFRAGRILNVPNPEPGVWTIRLQGGSPFFLSMQADTSLVLSTARFASGFPRLGAENLFAVSLNAQSPDAHFRLVDAAGETLQPLPLQTSEGRPSLFSGNVVLGYRQFRILAEGTDEHGYAFQRVDPRLLEATASLPLK